MPELPDIQVYLDALEQFVVGEALTSAKVRGPSLLRTYDPPLEDCVGRRVTGVRRIGKRVVLGLEGELFLVVHLMIAGRFQWRAPGALPKGRNDLATFGFEAGTLLLTEASKKKRAALHVVAGEARLQRFDRGGLDVTEASLEDFAGVLRARNHTLKRALTDPTILDGVGNAYSDEILHAARLSPLTWTTRLDDAELDRLYRATRETLATWTERLRAQRKQRFPSKVTAFRPEMAVHGRFREPCPACETAVQRIRYADRETNYCPRCQTGGKLLADRALSRLLKADWPRTIDELEELREAMPGAPS